LFTTESQPEKLELAETVPELRRRVAAARNQGARVGLVPTMGALHEGHFSLIRAARRETDFVVVTIFVNPAQFGPQEDFTKYPRPWDADRQACRKLGVDLIFQPAVETVYPPDFATFVDVERLSSHLEGRFRPGHFRGVATVVLKLFNMAAPDVAYFGQKDYQQQLLIQKMCLDLDLSVEIRICPTVREPDGLALSSRNAFLSAEERRSALALSQSLKLASDRITAGETNLPAIREAMLTHLRAAPGVNVDYATIAHPQTLQEIDSPLPEMVALVAARVGGTRLIDNVLIHL
jgi:pantoate--beta-alanine ligase